MRFGRIAWRIPLLAMAVVAWSAPANAETRTVTAPTDYWFTFTEPTVFSARTFSQSDPHLWLYREDGTLVAANDDTYGLDSYLLVPLESGTYRLRVGVCCGDPDRWYGGGFQVDFDHNPVEPTTTTLPEETTTTWEPTTTSTAPETTVTTTAPTSVAPVTEAPPTEPPTTDEPSLPPLTASEPSSPPPSDATEAPATTSPPATSVAPTSSPTPSFAPPVGTTTSLAPSPTVSVTSSSSSPVLTSTTPSTDPTTSTMPSSDSSPESVIPPPANNAPEQEKRAFEEEVNIFGNSAYDTYIPAGSTISVAERRTIIAATTATAFVLPTPTNRRRQK